VNHYCIAKGVERVSLSPVVNKERSGLAYLEPQKIFDVFAQLFASRENNF
jgi:hypothetical protein